MTNHVEVNQRYLDLVEVYDEVIKAYGLEAINSLIDSCYGFDIRTNRELSRNIFIKNHDQEQGNYTIVDALELQGYKANDYYFHKIYLLQILVDIADGKLEPREWFNDLLEHAERIVNPQPQKINNLYEFIALEPQIKQEVESNCKRDLDEDRDRCNQEFKVLANWMIRKLLEAVPELNFVNFIPKIEFDYQLNGHNKALPYGLSDYTRFYEAEVIGNLEHGISIGLTPVSSLIAKFVELTPNSYDDVEIKIYQQQTCKYRVLLNNGDSTFIKMELAKNLKDLVHPSEDNNVN